MGDIIAGTFTLDHLSSIDRAIDVTQYVLDGLTVEDPGDRRAQRINFQLMEKDGIFHPDTGRYAKYLMNGQVVRLVEGDDALDEDDWIVTFTGHIRGQVGFDWDRDRLDYRAQVTAYGRRATPKFLKQKFSSRTYGKGTEYGTICNDIASSIMNMTAVELERFPSSLGKVTQFSANSIVDLTPLEAIEKILETVGQVPEFDGDGVLRTYSRDLRRGASKIFNDMSLIFYYRVPSTEVETYNSVSVIGLDKNITEMEQPEQAVGRATIPVGFWRPRHVVRIPYSKDLKTRVRNATMVIETSINDHLWLEVGSESFSRISEFEGQIDVDITDYTILLATVIAASAAVWFALPDGAAPIGVQVDPVTGIGTTIPPGFTFPFGKVTSWLTMQLALYTLSLTGSGVYEIRGNPVIPIYQEINAIVTNGNIPDHLIHQKEIRNDWVNTEEELRELGLLELIWEVAQESPREVGLLNDWGIEVGDIIQIPLGGGVKLWVDGWRKTISRGQVPILEVTCYKVPAGL
ncbi:MAG TPA: hypothetical protein VNP04_13640 [Alphaproteobacteria bacterium]|nr:hypothetical protein [Alphaproteobacteria bacterium]